MKVVPFKKTPHPHNDAGPTGLPPAQCHSCLKWEITLLEHLQKLQHLLSQIGLTPGPVMTSVWSHYDT